VLSVSKEEGLIQVLKGRKISHRREEICGERSRDLGVGAPRGFPRANKNLWEVVKSGLNPNHWIWKGHVEVILTLQRSSTLGNIQRGYQETLEGQILNRSQSSITRRVGDC
jgi:hypothetical protein